jgi:hypothetical protein
MPFLELFDETLDINSTENYELSVQISPDNLAFAILDTIRNKYILLRSTESDDNKYLSSGDISEIISKDDFLTKKYRKVNIVLPSRKFTLVPAPLFDPAKKEEYFRFNHSRDDNEVILSNKVNDPDAYILYSIPGSIHEIPARFWPAAYTAHHTKPLISQVSLHSKSIPGFYVHVHIEKEFFNVLVYDHGVLKFSNSFTYRNISDILYFVLNIFKTMGISHDEPIYFSGQTGKYDDLWSGFAMYIRNLRFTDPSGSFSFSYVFNDLGLHRFINLFSISTCE